MTVQPGSLKSWGGCRHHQQCRVRSSCCRIIDGPPRPGGGTRGPQPSTAPHPLWLLPKHQKVTPPRAGFRPSRLTPQNRAPRRRLFTHPAAPRALECRRRPGAREGPAAEVPPGEYELGPALAKAGPDPTPKGSTSLVLPGIPAPRAGVSATAAQTAGPPQGKGLPLPWGCPVTRCPLQGAQSPGGGRGSFGGSRGLDPEPQACTEFAQPGPGPGPCSARRAQPVTQSVAFPLPPSARAHGAGGDGPAPGAPARQGWEPGQVPAPCPGTQQGENREVLIKTPRDLPPNMQTGPRQSQSQSRPQTQARP